MRKSTMMNLSVLLFMLGAFAAAWSQSFAVLHTFQGPPDGQAPLESKLLPLNGYLYGTTESGGSFGYGTIFRLDSKRHETVLYSFTGGADGSTPDSGVIADQNGKLYGTTFEGGDLVHCAIPLGCGVVYQLDLHGSLTVLHSFADLNDGILPTALVIDLNGTLYGNTQIGGVIACAGMPFWMRRNI